MVEQAILEQATARLVAGFQPQRIILFGSQAKGIAGPRSDVDLLIILQSSVDRRSQMLAMDRALKGLGIARDVLVLSLEEFEHDSRIPGTVARSALREGRILYDRARAA